MPGTLSLPLRKVDIKSCSEQKRDTRVSRLLEKLAIV